MGDRYELDGGGGIPIVLPVAELETRPSEQPLPRLEPELRNYRLLVAYDGAPFHGWQLQAELPTVQGELERAIKAVTGNAARVHGAGRTDTGVHALGQVANFRVRTHVAVTRLRPAMNAHLPREIRVLRADEAPETFHARFSAHWRRYRYLLAREETPFVRGRVWVPRGWPDLETMRAALPVLLGEHECRAFTTQPEGPYGCFLHEADWERWEGGLAFVVRANRFLYQMVRILVGTCVDIGRGRRPVGSIGDALAAGDRRAAGPLAPSSGLYLTDVGYAPPWPGDPPGMPPLPPLGTPS